MTPAPVFRTGFDAWLHTAPQLRWKPPARRRRRGPGIHHAYHHPVEGGFLAAGGALAGTAVLLVWMVALEFWFFEACLWATVWFYYAAFLACRWIYRRNIIGQAVRAVTGRRTVRAPYDPHGAPRHPVDLATLGEQDTDPYDTGRSRTRS